MPRLQPVLLAPHRPRAARLSRRSATASSCSRPRNSTILGAAKLTGRVRGFSVGVLAAATQEEVGIASAFGGAALDARSVEPQTFYSVSRARREFSDQSSLGFILTTTSRQPGRLGVVHPDSALDRRRGLRLAHRPPLGPERLLGRQQRQRQHGGHRRAAAQQRPQLPAARRRPRRARSAGRLAERPLRRHQLQQDRRRAHARQRQHRLQVAGIRRQRSRLPAAGRPDPAERWLQIRWDEPGKLRAQQHASTSTSGRRTTSTATGWSLGGNFNAHWQFQNHWNTGFGVNFNADELRRPPDARRTRRRTTANINGWQYLNTDDRKLVQPGWNSNFGNDRPRLTAGRTSSRASCCGPTAALLGRVRHLLRPTRSTTRSGSRASRARRSHALRLRPARSERPPR